MAENQEQRQGDIIMNSSSVSVYPPFDLYSVIGSQKELVVKKLMKSHDISPKELASIARLIELQEKLKSSVAGTRHLKQGRVRPA